MCLGTQGGLVWSGPPPPSPASPVCCCGETLFSRPGERTRLPAHLITAILSPNSSCSCLLLSTGMSCSSFNARTEFQREFSTWLGLVYKQELCLGLLCVCVRVCVPSPQCSEGLLEEFLFVCRKEKLPQSALEIVQFSASFCLSATQKLARSVLADFDLTDEQR